MHDSPPINGGQDALQENGYVFVETIRASWFMILKFDFALRTRTLPGWFTKCFIVARRVFMRIRIYHDLEISVVFLNRVGNLE